MERPASVVIWDRRRRVLRSFRDKLGLVLLAYIAREDSLVLSSRMKWLTSLGGVDLRPNRQFLAGFLVGGPHSQLGRSDAVEQIRRVYPGEACEWRRKGERRFFQYFNPETSYQRSAHDYQGEFRQRLRDAINRSHQRKGDHVVLLSGGVDSPTVASLYAQTRRESGDRSLTCASVVSHRFDGLDESTELRRLEQVLPIDLHRWSADDRWVLNPHGVPGEPELEEGPPSYPSYFWHVPFMAWAGARGDGRVMTGAAADVLQMVTVREVERYLFNRGDWISLRRELLSSGGIKAVKTLTRLVTDRLGVAEFSDAVARAVRHSIQGFLFQDSRPWLDPARWTNQLSMEAKASVPETKSSTETHGEYKLRWLRSWQWERFVRVYRVNCRRARVTASHPFMSANLWEWVIRLPPELLVRNGLRKFLLRSAMQDKLPSEILFRERTAYFDNLIDAGLGLHATNFVEELFQPESYLADLGLIQPESFLEAYRAYGDYVRCNLAGVQYVGSRFIWRAVAAEMWLRALNGTASDEVQLRL